MIRRPLGVLVAAAVAVSTFAGASAANAALVSHGPSSLVRASDAAHAEASAALAGLALPTASAERMRAAVTLAGAESLPLDTTIPVKVAAKHYDIHVRSTGAKTAKTTITLFMGAHRLQLSTRRLVEVTVIRHGYTHPLLETTTTFKRFVVMLTGLESSPMQFTSIHFATRSDFVAAITHGLSIDSAEVVKEYGALLRLAQMSLDLSASLLAADEYVIANPTATDLSAVPTVQTTAGSGGYAGTVTMTGTFSHGVPQDFTVAVTNTTDASSLTETFSSQAITITYVVGGKTYTQTISLAF